MRHGRVMCAALTAAVLWSLAAPADNVQGAPARSRSAGISPVCLPASDMGAGSTAHPCSMPAQPAPAAGSAVPAPARPANGAIAAGCAGLLALSFGALSGFAATQGDMAGPSMILGMMPRCAGSGVVGRASGLLARTPLHHPASSATDLRLPVYVSPGSPAPDSTGGGYLVLGLKFAVVLALLLLCLRVLRSVMPRLSGRGGPQAGAMVLHAETVGVKQTVQVLDLGARLLLVGVTGASMTTLTTIDNPEEVALLRARYTAMPRAEVQAAVRAEDREGRPSFAGALALASAALGKASWIQTDARSARRPREMSAAADAGSTGRGRGAGDPVVGDALRALRALRARFERA